MDYNRVGDDVIAAFEVMTPELSENRTVQHNCPVYLSWLDWVLCAEKRTTLLLPIKPFVWKADQFEI